MDLSYEHREVLYIDWPMGHPDLPAEGPVCAIEIIDLPQNLRAEAILRVNENAGTVTVLKVKSQTIELTEMLNERIYLRYEHCMVELALQTS